jgi:hypothetical protein
MAEGLGFKTFTTGEVLTAADVNGYLMQGVLVFASEAARDAAITSPQEGQFAFTKDNNSLWYYSGAAWVASGATGDIEGVTAGVGISGGGTSGTVTITNSMATTIDAAGDIIYGTGNDAFTKLGIGTVGQVLQVNSGATAPEWGTASAGAMTKITSGTFTDSGGVAINNCFTSTYINYVVILSGFKVASTSQTLFLQMQTATSTVYSGSQYYGGVFQVTESATTAATGNSAANKWTLGTSSSTARQNITINFSGVGNTSENANYSANGNLAVAGASFAGGIVNNNDTYTGLYFTGTGNISGRYAIYGLEN